MEDITRKENPPDLTAVMRRKTPDPTSSGGTELTDREHMPRGKEGW